MFRNAESNARRLPLISRHSSSNFRYWLAAKCLPKTRKTYSPTIGICTIFTVQCMRVSTPAGAMSVRLLIRSGRRAA